MVRSEHKFIVYSTHFREAEERVSGAALLEGARVLEEVLLEVHVAAELFRDGGPLRHTGI